MTPLKWLTLKHTVSPGRTIQSYGKNYSVVQEDLFVKAWFPILNTSKWKMLIGPSYRTEQLDFRGANQSAETGMERLGHWNLRSAGLDNRLVYQINDHHGIIFGFNSAYSATVSEYPLFDSPLQYAASVLFIVRKSPNSEKAFGLLYTNSLTTLPVLPVFVWNQTFNSRHGLEVSLPHKIAFRYNLSRRDIFHVKAEGSTRSYFVKDEECMRFRRKDIDFGISYTKLLNNWIGFELFSGYRCNLSNTFPTGVALDKSGAAVSVEFFVLPAFKRK